MQLNCYRDRRNCLLDIDAFSVFIAEDKYVVGLTEDDHERWLLPERVSLKELLSKVPGLMRVNRSVLVSRDHVKSVSGTRDERCIHASGHRFKLSRDEALEPFQLAAIKNHEHRSARLKAKRIRTLQRSVQLGSFAVFRVEQKYVIGLTVDREVCRLPAWLCIKDILSIVPGVMRVNRSVVVARSQVKSVTGPRDDRCVRAFGQDYDLSRELDPEPFRIAAFENNATLAPYGPRKSDVVKSTVGARSALYTGQAAGA